MQSPNTWARQLEFSHCVLATQEPLSTEEILRPAVMSSQWKPSVS